MRLLRVDYYDNYETIEEYIDDVIKFAIECASHDDCLRVAARAYIVPRLQEKANRCGISLAAEGHACSGDIVYVRLTALNRR